MKWKEKFATCLFISVFFYSYLTSIEEDVSLNKTCTNYAVMAVRQSTDNVPESIRRFMYIIHEHPDWCFVAVISDSQSNQFTLNSSWALYESLRSRFIALSAKNDLSINEKRNLGYQYAILNVLF